MENLVNDFDYNTKVLNFRNEFNAHFKGFDERSIETVGNNLYFKTNYIGLDKVKKVDNEILNPVEQYELILDQVNDIRKEYLDIKSKYSVLDSLISKINFWDSNNLENTYNQKIKDVISQADDYAKDVLKYEVSYELEPIISSIKLDESKSLHFLGKDIVLENGSKLKSYELDNVESIRIDDRGEVLLHKLNVDNEEKTETESNVYLFKKELNNSKYIVDCGIVNYDYESPALHDNLICDGLSKKNTVIYTRSEGFKVDGKKDLIDLFNSKSNNKSISSELSYNLLISNYPFIEKDGRKINLDTSIKNINSHNLEIFIDGSQKIIAIKSKEGSVKELIDNVDKFKINSIDKKIEFSCSKDGICSNQTFDLNKGILLKQSTSKVQATSKKHINEINL